MGALAPMVGFGPADSEVTLSVPAEVARWAGDVGALELVDPEGVPLAVLSLAETYPLRGDVVGLVGSIRPLPGVIRRAFGDLYVPPSATRAGSGADTLTVPVDAPLTAGDLAAIGDAAEGRAVLLLVFAGHGTPRGVSAHGLIRATRAAAAALDNAPLDNATPDTKQLDNRQLDNVQIAVVPVAKREDPAADADLRRRVVAAYAPGEVLAVDGAGPLPEAVAEIVAADRPSGVDQGLVVFFTGLSGSGKSTIAQALRDTLLERGTRTVSLLDGDRVRRSLCAGLTFSPEDRETNIERIGWVAAEISRHGGMAICSPIAPADRIRQAARAMTEEVGGAFVLVHVATPLAECERRDRKGLYAKARRGEIEHFTGISAPYEPPTDADLRIDTTGRTVAEVLDEVLALLDARGLIAIAGESPR